jgi:hypothetical protein
LFSPRRGRSRWQSSATDVFRGEALAILASPDDRFEDVVIVVTWDLTDHDRRPLGSAACAIGRRSSDAP